MPQGYPVTVDPEQIREMYQTQRMSLSSIATTLGCCVSKVKSSLVKAGAAPKKHPRSPDFVLEDVKRMYLEENLVVPKIAKKYKCNVTTVRDYIVKNGFLKVISQQRKRFQRFTATEGELREMYLDRCISDPKIAQELQVSVQTVVNWRRKYGIFREHRAGTTVVDVEELKRMYVTEKRTVAYIAEQLGTTGAVVRYNISKNELLGETGKFIRRRTKKPGGRKMLKKGGYFRFYSPSHPSANKSGYVEEHRHVMQVAMGRLLKPGELVHHINLKRDDNLVGNLAVLSSNREHAAVHSYMDKLLIYMLGLSDVKPPNLQFKEPTFWGGKYITELDLLEMVGYERLPLASSPTVNRATAELVNVVEQIKRGEPFPASEELDSALEKAVAAHGPPVDVDAWSRRFADDVCVLTD